MSEPHAAPPGSDDAVEEAAATWLSERDVGLTPEQSDAYQRWRNADPRHAAAIALLEETRSLLACMPVLKSDAALRSRMEQLQGSAAAPANVVAFPKWLATAAAIAACLALSLAVWWPRAGSSDAPELPSFATTAGETRRIVLPDQSVVDLNENTRLQLQFSPGERRVRLLSGQAHFAVQKDPGRVFVVAAAGISVRAVGTAFAVGLHPADVEVLVTEGRVQVERESGTPAPSAKRRFDPSVPTYIAGQRIVVGLGTDAPFIPQITSINATATRQALAASSPWLKFDATPLSDVVRQFNACNALQLEIGDAELSSHAVGGTFQADGVESFLRLLEESGDVAIERPSADRVVLRKAAQPQR
jgi:transmembrane sensor